MTKWIPVILFTVLTNAIAQIMLKKAMLAVGEVELRSDLLVSIFGRILFETYAGLCVLVISMASHLYVLSKVELSFAYPFLSLAYVVVLAYAFFVFDEKVGIGRIGGVALICLGTFLVARS